MKTLRTSILLLIAFVVFYSAFHASAGEPAKAEWKLVWSDEFDGTEIDKTKWDFERGSGSWSADGKTWLPGFGNNELQFYTKRPENAHVRDGMLHICAIKEQYKGAGYTSAKLKTRKADLSPLYNKMYGRFEIRAKAPLGKGLWPAIWMLPQDDKFGGWASSGEIDILEARGQEPNKVLGTLHYGGSWPVNTHTGKDYILPDNGTIADFHVYTVEWEPGEIRWLVDGKLYQTQNFWWSCSDKDGPKGVNPVNESELNPWPAPFNHPYYIILNLAVGGQFLGNPDKTTIFPAEMVVDYVRVYEKVGGYGPVPARGEGKLPFNK
ncbi:MAG: glycoside hydrolase family 16 protein [Planctomycetota bacterium]